MKNSVIAILTILVFVAGLATYVQAESLVSIGDSESLYTNGTSKGMDFEWVVRPKGNSFETSVYWMSSFVQLDNFCCTEGMAEIGVLEELRGYGYYYIQIDSSNRSILCVPAELFERGIMVVSEDGLVIVSNMDTRWYTEACNSDLGPFSVPSDDMLVNGCCNPQEGPPPVPSDDMLVNPKPTCDPNGSPPSPPLDEDLVQVLDQYLEGVDQNGYPNGVVFDPWLEYPSQTIKKPVDVM